MPEPRPTLDDVTGKAKEKAVHAERDRALTKSSGPDVPARGAIFLLSEAGHRRAGYTEAEAKALFALRPEEWLEIPPIPEANRP